MHRDKKLGLALGILLVGAAGALFFRNNPIQSAQLPELENSQALDAAIREQSGSLPYLTEADPVSAQNAPPPGPVRTPRLVGEVPPPIAAHAGSTLPHSQGVDAPAALDASPVANRASSGQGGGRREQVYLVQAGDTLTGLASRFLGSSARFLDIYRANQDVLKSPNDLRAGMTIRIPEVASAPPPGVAAPSHPRMTGPTESPRSLPPVETPFAGQIPARPAASSTPKSPAPATARRQQPQPRPKTEAWIEPREDDPEEPIEEPYSPSTAPKSRLFVPVPRAQLVRGGIPPGTDAR